MDDLTVTEAARELGISRSTVLKQIRNGALQAERIGPILVISPSEVKRYRATSLGRPGRKRPAVL